jgi:methylated-DNA-[protein]-cysteine S-methyltransferase
MELNTLICGSPFGKISIYSSETGIVRMTWEDISQEFLSKKGLSRNRNTKWHQAHPILKEAFLQLDSYFNKQLKVFSLPFDLRGTPFQLKVWENLCKIPYGKTWSYYDLAKAVGNPKSVRAVGRINAQNPIPIIIPCHRVIRKNGNLGGYSGGLVIKDWLLRHEGVLL